MSRGQNFPHPSKFPSNSAHNGIERGERDSRIWVANLSQRLANSRGIEQQYQHIQQQKEDTRK